MPAFDSGHHHGTHLLTEPVGSGLLSDDPLDQAVARMTLELQNTGRARVPRELAPDRGRVYEAGVGPQFA